MVIKSELIDEIKNDVNTVNIATKAAKAVGLSDEHVPGIVEGIAVFVLDQLSKHHALPVDTFEEKD